MKFQVGDIVSHDAHEPILRPYPENYLIIAIREGIWAGLREPEGEPYEGELLCIEKCNSSEDKYFFETIKFVVPAEVEKVYDFLEEDW